MQYIFNNLFGNMPKYVLYNTVAQPYYLLYVFCLCNDLAIDPSAPRSDDKEDLVIVRTSRRGGGAGSQCFYTGIYV